MSYTPNPHVPVVDLREQKPSGHLAIPPEALVAAGVAPHNWSPDYGECLRCGMSFAVYGEAGVGCVAPKEREAV